MDYPNLRIQSCVMCLNGEVINTLILTFRRWLRSKQGVTAMLCAKTYEAIHLVTALLL